MSRPLAQDTEIARRRDQPTSKVMHPDPVDDDTGHQWMSSADQVPRVGQSATGRRHRLVVEWQLDRSLEIHDRQFGGFDLLLGLLVIAPEVNKCRRHFSGHFRQGSQEPLSWNFRTDLLGPGRECLQVVSRFFGPQPVGRLAVGFQLGGRLGIQLGQARQGDLLVRVSLPGRVEELLLLLPPGRIQLSGTDLAATVVEIQRPRTDVGHAGVLLDQFLLLVTAFSGSQPVSRPQRFANLLGHQQQFFLQRPGDVELGLLFPFVVHLDRIGLDTLFLRPVGVGVERQLAAVWCLPALGVQCRFEDRPHAVIVGLADRVIPMVVTPGTANRQSQQ